VVPKTSATVTESVSASSARFAASTDAAVSRESVVSWLSKRLADLESRPARLRSWDWSKKRIARLAACSAV
jgi:hypothetical protein